MMNGLMSNPGVLVSILLFAAVAFMVTVMVLKYVKRNQMAVERRLKNLNYNSLEDNAQSVQKSEQKKQSGLMRKLSELGFVASLADELLAADIMLKAEEYLTIWFLAATIPALLVLLLFQNIMLTVLFAVLGSLLPLLYIRSMKTKKRQQFDYQLGDALLMMSNCLTSGLSFPQAMESIAREMPDPIASEFGRVTNEIRFGKTLEQALNDMIERIKSQDLMIAMNAVLIQHQVGGNLAEILATIAETVKDRIQIKKDIRVMTSQGRISGMVIGALPVFLFVALLIINPSYMTMFFTEDLGRILLVVGLLMELIGFLLIKKVIDIKY